METNLLEQAAKHNKAELEKLFILLEEIKPALSRGENVQPFLDDLNISINSLDDQISLFNRTGDNDRKLLASTLEIAVLKVKCAVLEIVNNWEKENSKSHSA